MSPSAMARIASEVDFAGPSKKKAGNDALFGDWLTLS